MSRTRATEAHDPRSVRGKIARIRHHAPRILIRKPPFRIVFHHVPKCGGTSVIRAVSRCFPLQRRALVAIDSEASIRSAKIGGRPVHGVREELLLYYMALPGTAFISGHVPFSERAFNEYGQGWSFVTVLREPVKRWISHYYYRRYRAGARDVEGCDSLEKYMESPEGLRHAAVYTRYFSGVPEGPPDVERAIQMIKKFTIVGSLEDLDGFVRMFSERFGKEIRIPYLNRTPAPESLKTQHITSELRARVEEICEADIAFYQSVVSTQVKQS